jgi:DNA-cytosine methyltransferase
MSTTADLQPQVRLPLSAGASSTYPALRTIWVVEDDAQTHDRQRLPGVLRERTDIRVALHRVVNSRAALEAARTYESGSLEDPRLGRSGVALRLLDAAGATSGLVVAGTTYGNNRAFIPGVRSLGYHVAVEVRRRSQWLTEACVRSANEVTALDRLSAAQWSATMIPSPETNEPVAFQFADLGLVHRGEPLRLFAFSPGTVIDTAADLRLAVTSLTTIPIPDIITGIGWARWIRTLSRRQSRRSSSAVQLQLPGAPLPVARIVSLPTRPNIRLARQHDQLLPTAASPPPAQASPTTGRRTVIELFAGAGGLGLGFVLARSQDSHYEILESAEVEPIYVETLRRNHSYFREHLTEVPHQVPEELKPMDLRSRSVQDRLASSVKAAGGLHVLIGGPPCQGFSNANRNSWAADNPHNQLVDVFLKLVRRLQPRIALMENVQGILWTDRSGSTSRLTVADHIVRSLQNAGYLAFPKLLDAVWYGVPQHRSRFFLLAIHRDLGYQSDCFGDWGPFPTPTHGPATAQPYVTVKDAIGDLPEIGNGFREPIMPYSDPDPDVLANNPFLTFMRQGSQRSIIHDHITSRHAGYVIDRYHRIPEGGNWQDITDMMSNYTEVDRTHSNIYRRLKYGEPSITMGHYRKSMLVHPTQDRGLSLREAARLQSMPDWFRFAGALDDRSTGLMHQQQQLANAVCPLVSMAVANHLLGL